MQRGSWSQWLYRKLTCLVWVCYYVTDQYDSLWAGVLLSGRPLFYLLLHLFNDHNLIQQFRLDILKLMHFLSKFWFQRFSFKTRFRHSNNYSFQLLEHCAVMYYQSCCEELVSLVEKVSIWWKCYAMDDGYFGWCSCLFSCFWEVLYSAVRYYYK